MITQTEKDNIMIELDRILCNKKYNLSKELIDEIEFDLSIKF